MSTKVRVYRGAPSCKRPAFNSRQGEPIFLSQRTKAEILLVLVTFIWGSTFVIVKSALNDAAPLPFLAVRFTLAGLLLFAVMARRGFDFTAVLPGVILGFLLFCGYAFQTFGLRHTTPSKCAFITGFSVILVPMILLLAGHGVRAAGIGGAVLGLAGLYFLVLPSGRSAVNRGDLLTLGGAIAFAIHIVLVGAYTQRFSFTHLVPVQILAVGLLAAALLAVEPGLHLHLTRRLAVAWAITGVLATGFAFTVQNWAQQYTPAAHTALIFALEPVFAALTSCLVAGERLGGKALVGSGMVLAGMVISEVWARPGPSPVEG